MNLAMEVQNIKGVGEKTATRLAKAGILTVSDLLYNLPRDYEHYQAASKIIDVRPGKIAIRGKIDDFKTRYARRRHLSVTEATISDNTGSIRVVWFNQPYRAKQFIPGREYYFQGAYELHNGRFQLTSPTAKLATDVDQMTNFQPIYAMHGELKPNFFKNLIGKFRGSFATIPDLLPITKSTPDFVKPGVRGESLFRLHFPENATDVEQGRKYLAYEELFEYILAAKLNRQETQKLTAIALEFQLTKTRELVGSLPFKMTNAQRRVAWEILQDLEKNTPMNRLLQGDVGAGKTVVAALAAYQAICNGHQVAFLAPTAILATQHANKLDQLLAPLGVKVALLTGATKNKSVLKKQIASGEVNLVVGTHALLTDDTKFHSLAFCIIDEQHRFGVNQRQKLLLKSPENIAPHLLSMTATPIPRSLQLTVFGDLDISVINELPGGRRPIKTRVLPELHFQEYLYPKVREVLAKNQQIYWICPAVDDNPTAETTSVKKQAKKLQDIFKEAKVAYLHGRMKPAEKDQIMDDFLHHKIDILVSTTVVEVGVDVPNATLMVVMDAEHYGLAQLHQLRGRVGRGDQQSYCFLATPDDHTPSRRLQELTKSTDGFYLSEVDLKLRGPGEIYGALQHGALNLRIANLTDTRLSAAANRHATEIAKNPANMLKYKELNQRIKQYQQLITLN